MNNFFLSFILFYKKFYGKITIREQVTSCVCTGTSNRMRKCRLLLLLLLLLFDQLCFGATQREFIELSNTKSCICIIVAKKFTNKNVDNATVAEFAAKDDGSTVVQR